MTEDEVFSTTKALSDTAFVTDDVDGVLGDDQTFVFFKVLNNGLILQPSDNLFLANGKQLANSSALTDAGVIILQDYCDTGYFLSDYVGSASTF